MDDSRPLDHAALVLQLDRLTRCIREGTIDQKTHYKVASLMDATSLPTADHSTEGWEEVALAIDRMVAACEETWSLVYPPDSMWTREMVRLGYLDAVKRKALTGPVLAQIINQKLMG
jgi:hypothetical protein